jgi:hypothetical protein
MLGVEGASALARTDMPALRELNLRKSSLREPGDTDPLVKAKWKRSLTI